MFTAFGSWFWSFVRAFLAGLDGGWWWFGVFALAVWVGLLLGGLVLLVWGVWWWLAWPLAAWAARWGGPRLACALMVVLPAAPGLGVCACGATVTPPDVCVVCGIHHPARRSAGG